MEQLDVEAIVDSIARERTVDIVTIGRRTGTARTTEIWTTLVDGELYICGTPSEGRDDAAPMPRDWLANLLAEPAFTLRLKESIHVDLPARATVVTDPEERRRLVEAPPSEYYRRNSRSIEGFVADAPVVRVDFVDAAAAVSTALRAARSSGPT